MGTTLLSRHTAARRLTRRALSFPALIVTALTAACGGTGLTSTASVENVTRVYSVFAVTGTSNALPSAYSYTTESLVRPQVLSSGGINFDLAFDLTADGKARLLPAKYVVPLPPAGSPIIGVQKMAGTFAQLERAPTNGYTADSAVTASAGETYTLELRNSGCIYGEYYYAKLSIDSIIVPERRLVVRSLVNRNCGFRGLTDGIPKN
jgi:hypothetical protein